MKAKSGCKDAVRKWKKVGLGAKSEQFVRKFIFFYLATVVTTASTKQNHATPRMLRRADSPGRKLRK
jgi:hypothetical protein